MNPKDLVGISEIAAMAKVTRAAVCMWRTRYNDFPSPVVQLRCGAIFHKMQVANWLFDFGIETEYRKKGG